VVPAQRITIPLSASGTFDATGTRVAVTKATGSARFENRDPTSSNRIPAGSIVRTDSGVRFQTDQALTVPRAELVGLTIFPARASVGITAVLGGPEGNVDAGQIDIVPNGESPLFLKVTNPDPTSGGTRQEFKRVTQQDVDGAVATLNASLQDKLTQAMADPSLTTGGATVIPSTGQVGTTTPSVPPESLVGQEVATFDLGLSANGTVIAVDTAPVHAIAEQELKAEVDPDHQLVAGSTDIKVGDAVVNGQSVSFPVTVSAQQIAVLDPAELTAMVVGKPVDEAKAILAPYGDVQLTVSPDWSGSVPSFESRVHLTIGTPVQIESPAPSGSPGP
jgi:baseplate J-like protein